MEKTYLLIDEEKRGPYSEEELKGLVEAGTVTAETPCWREGMSEWQALGAMSALNPPRNTTVAPPRRTQKAEKSHTYVATDYRNQALKGHGLSARVKPLTLVNSIGLLILFFLFLSILIYVLGHAMPDLGKQFQDTIESL